jgi:RNA recognition motif-containing protein
MGLEENRDKENSTSRRKRKASSQEIEIDITAAEPPSKKALRKEKKKSSQKKDDMNKTVPESPTRAKSSDTSKPQKAAEKSHCGIWMGNLPFTTTKDDIKKFLADKSAIKSEDITRVHIPSSKGSSSTPGPPQAAKVKNKGFAYVDLATEDALKAAISLSEKLITGRRVLIKDAKNFQGRPEKDTAAGNSTTTAISLTNRVFVGNLSFDTTKEDLEEHFATCGEVSDVHVATFEDSGKCKGFAWVTFTEIQSAALAMQGWVKVPMGEDEDDDVASEGDENGDTVSKPRSRKKGKKQKMRKVFVNRLKGRPMRMEFAEDKAVRYKKRFRKDGTANKRLQSAQEDAKMTQAENDDSARSQDQQRQTKKPSCKGMMGNGPRERKVLQT